YNLSVQGKGAAISDRNFLDQYFNAEWVNGLNQENFVYRKQQENNWAWTFLTEVRDRNWITETNWLPKVEGYWIGQDFFNLFTNTLKGSAGYAHLQPTHQPPPAFEPTDVNRQTGRFDLRDELALPFPLGPFKFEPYVVGDFTYYTNEIPGDDVGRLYYGGGVRGSIPFSRLYADVQSELFNLNGLYHKMVLSGDYYWAHSSVSHTLLPQLDRLNDDASDQALRDIRPLQTSLNPAHGVFLNSGFFDPQLFPL